MDRPTHTTVTIRVGYSASGIPRLETHSWNNLRIAYLRQDQEPAERPVRGRPRIQTENSKMAVEMMPDDLPPNLSDFWLKTGSQNAPIWLTFLAKKGSKIIFRTKIRPFLDPSFHMLSNSTSLII